ncbi:MAG: host attachment protein [Rhizomicrobium sp.]
MMPTDNDTLVLVFDSAVARFFRPHRDGHLEQTLAEANERLHHDRRDIEADRPGRGGSAHGGERHAYESENDPRKLEKHDFIRALVKELSLGLDRNEFKNLIVVGQERALGEFRKLAPEKLKRATLHEILKDLTKLPLGELEQHLMKDLGPR